jgi:type II secretory pathway component PulL
MAINILGVDFREQAVSAVLIRGGYKGIEIAAHAHVFLDQEKTPETGLEACLEAVSEQADLAGAVCVASLPSDRFYYRNIQSPFTDLQKIDQTLPYELEPSLPLSADDLVIDFVPIDTFRPDENILKRIVRRMGLSRRPASMPLLAAALEKSQVADCLSLLKSFGLEPERIVPGGYALASCLVHAPHSPDNWLLVDADISHTALFLVLSRTLTVIRAFPGAETSLSAAEMTARLLPRIQQTLLASCAETGIERIYLAGELPDASAVAADISAACDLPVHWLNLISDMDIRFPSDLPLDWRPETGDGALALTLMRMNGINGLNLRKGAFAASASWTACRPALLRTACVAGFTMLAAFVYVRIDMGILQNRLDGITRRIDQVVTGTFPEITTLVDPLQQMREHVHNAERRIPGGNIAGRRRLIDILSGISSRIPENVPVELVRFSYEENALQVTGHTDSFNFVEEIKRRLEGPNGGFSQVTILSATMDSSGNRVQFYLEIKL